MSAYKLVAKLSLVIFVLSVCLGVLGVSQMVAISETNSDYSSLVRQEMSRMQALRLLTGGFFQVNRACLSSLVDSSAENQLFFSRTAAQHLAALVPHLEALKTASHSSNPTLQELSSLTTTYSGEVNQFFKILGDGKELEAKEFRANHLRPRIERINEVLGQIASDSNSNISIQIQKLNKDSSKAGILGMFFSFWPFLVIIAAIFWTALISLKFLSTADVTSEIPGR